MLFMRIPRCYRSIFTLNLMEKVEETAIASQFRPVFITTGDYSGFFNSTTCWPIRRPHVDYNKYKPERRFPEAWFILCSFLIPVNGENGIHAEPAGTR